MLAETQTAAHIVQFGGEPTEVRVLKTGRRQRVG